MTNHPNRPTAHRHGTGTITWDGSQYITTIETHTYPSRNPNTWTTRDHDSINESRIYVTGCGKTTGEAQRTALARYAEVDGGGEITWSA